MTLIVMLTHIHFSLCLKVLGRQLVNLIIIKQNSSFQAVFEGTWPTTKSRGAVLWKKVRNVIIGVAQFRRGIRRRSISLYSNSGSEYDQISHASIDSFIEDIPQGIVKSESMTKEHQNGDTVNHTTPGTTEESSSTGLSVFQSL